MANPSGPIFSASWYRVAGLKPSLRTHARIDRHQYRGDTWYVLQDLSKERFFRFSPTAYALIGLMDGRRTVNEIWEGSCQRLEDQAPTQDEIVQLLSQLYRADVLLCDVPPDTAELLERYTEQTRRRIRSQWFSFLSWRLPLVDPERFLERMLPLVRPFFSWIGAALWLAIVVPAVVVAVTHWSDLTMNVLDQLLLPQNLALVWLLFPIIKGCHELGHAFATKVFGGEVHDMGIMLLVLTPVPYVDASSASGFRTKWQRVMVGVAGIAVEMVIAAVALFIWVSAEPGALRTLAYRSVLIAGVSTLAFNANPLLRYDGYYILADLIEIPNLRGRANAYLGYLCQRFAFGRVDMDVPETTRGERLWFVAFGILSFVYRTFVLVAILFYLAQRLFYLGTVLAVVGAIAWTAMPVVQGVKFLLSDPALRRVRGRAIGVSAAFAAIVAVLVGLVPAPYRTSAEGVVWIPDEAFVRAGADGFIDRIVAEPGGHVKAGDVLVLMSDPALAAQAKVLAAHAVELEATSVQYLFTDRVKAETAADELRYVRDQLARSRQLAAELTVRSRTAGTFVLPTAQDLPGRFVKQGALLGHVVELDAVTVRAVVPQDAIDLVRSETRGASVRLSEEIGVSYPAVIRRLTPGATEQLPSRALGTVGGGDMAVDPRDQQGLKAVARVFQVDLELSSRTHLVNVGGRGYVRFDHGWSPLLFQWYRAVRQLFLSRFNV